MSDDSVARSDALDAKLEDNPVVTNLVKVARQHGLILKILVGSLIFDFALSGAVFYLTVESSHTATQAAQAAKVATSAQTRVYNQCLAGNDSRHTQLQLWEFILKIPPDPNLSPEAKQRQHTESVAFRKYVENKLAPRDCQHLKPVRTSSGALRFVPLPRQPGHTSPPQRHESAGGTPEAAPRPTPRPAASPTHHPRSHHSNSPSSKPSSSPSPTPLACVLGKCISPLPHHNAAVLGSGSGPGSGGRVPVEAVAAGLLLLACPCWLNSWRKHDVQARRVGLGSADAVGPRGRAHHQARSADLPHHRRWAESSRQLVPRWRLRRH